MDFSARDSLMKSIMEDDDERVIELISSGISLEADPRHGNTPLRAASQCGSIRVLRALLKFGADPNERITYRSSVDKLVEQDFTPLMYASNVEAIDVLIEFGAEVNAVSATGLSPIMRAAHFGRADLVESFLKHGADASLRQHKQRGRRAHTALELAEKSLSFWESMPKEHLKPQACETIEAHRKTVELLRAITAT
jgi:uncharacterized protein